MDYKKNVEGLKQKRETFKPTVGTYKVSILSEPEEDKFINHDDGKVVEQMKLEVKVMSRLGVKECYWYVSKGITIASLWGQLNRLGSEKGKLKDQTLTLLVKNDGTKNNYTILEVQDLIAQDQDEYIP